MRIEAGDTVVKTYPGTGGTVRYKVIGFSTHGKCVMQAPRNRNRTTAWWRTEDELPNTYHLEKRGQHGD
jgi:hypothetical protein